MKKDKDSCLVNIYSYRGITVTAVMLTKCLQMLTNPLLTEGRVRPVGSALNLSS